MGAAALAEQRSALLRKEAQRPIAASQTALASAEAAIGRMETEAEEQAITGLRDELAQARSAAQVAAQARQIEELQRQAQQRDAELAQARMAALEQARLAGEVAALQRQLQEQTALVERLARGG